MNFVFRSLEHTANFNPPRSLDAEIARTDTHTQTATQTLALYIEGGPRPTRCARLLGPFDLRDEAWTFETRPGPMDNVWT